MKEQIQLSDHFTYGRLIRFTLPSIGMMIFMSIYGVVDGFFVSNFAGKTPFAAVTKKPRSWFVIVTVPPPGFVSNVDVCDSLFRRFHMSSAAAMSFSISGRMLSLYLDRSALWKQERICGMYWGFARPT